MRFVLGVIAILVLLAIGVVVVLYSGKLDLSARDQPHPLVGWLVETAQRQSVRAHAGGTEVPSLGDPEMVEAGARLYLTDCVQCHGAPGAPSQPFARAMRPEPPDLTDSVRHWTSAELFWIIKNGLAFSGHPAAGQSRVDAELWPVVAFINQMPTMDVARWQSLTAPPAPPPPEPQPEAEPGATDVVPPSEEDAPAPAPAPASPVPEPPTEAEPAPQRP